jgi:hypothetical protein
MDEKQTKVSSFLTRLLPEFKVNTKVGVNPLQIAEIAAIIFIAFVVIYVSYLTLKKAVK